jgi:transposase
MRRAGISAAETDAILLDAGYDVPESTLRGWKTRKMKNGSAFSEFGSPGRTPLLDALQHSYVVGFVLSQNAAKKKVNRQTVLTFIKEKLGVNMSIQTVGNVLRDAGFVFKVGKKDSASASPNEWSINITTAEDFLNDIKRDKSIGRNFYNIDSTYTSHYSDDKRTFSASGAATPRIEKKLSVYTNCIVTCFGSDGSQPPSMLFTSNPAFKIDASNHAARKRARAHLGAMLKLYKINVSRIVCLEDTGTSYTRESPHIIRTYLGMTQLNAWCFFSDNGSAYRQNGASVIEEMGHRHRYLPASIHQYLSVNDNNAHGVAKAKWRAMGLDYSDDVCSSLALMRELDLLKPLRITKWFNRNYLLDQSNIQTQSVETLVARPNLKRREEHHVSLGQYMKMFEPLSATAATYEYEVYSDLDGAYWLN